MLNLVASEMCCAERGESMAWCSYVGEDTVDILIKVLGTALRR